MNLTTRYLGLELKTPLMPGASPLATRLDNIRRLEDAGASAIVLHSLFAEQIEGNAVAVSRHIERWQDTFAEATSFFPQNDDYLLGPDEYLNRITAIKTATNLPVIASLNGTHLGTWTDYARLMEKAGADALELNTYFMATRRDESGEAVEQRVLDIARAVRASVRIPIAVKLSPFYTSTVHLTGQLEDAGIDGVVLFNRIFQPEIDIETFDVVPKLGLSSPEDLRVRLRALALLRDQVKVSLACSGGVHTAADVVKALLAGADAIQIVAALLRDGPDTLGTILAELKVWMEKFEYNSVAEMRGALSLRNCPDPEAYERGNYLRSLQLWRE
ncbi:MAG: dihydroorotate dehydrogenase-like protein [Candidatus Didemnitutus sp.]|jgi:dihydroorotate dehydrogenase (fumarate)|nr:dihydroorotate dehydrogenase-like protein [Candidatus Didemnitutus sp.]